MRRISFLTSAFLMLLISTTALAAETPLIASGNPNLPPISWERNDVLTGVGVQLAEDILTELGVAHTVKPMGNWQQVQEKAQKGTVDLIVSAYPNSERRQYLEYSVPYLKSPVIIVVKKGTTFPFTGWEDLIGKKGAANLGESFGEKFDGYIKENLRVTHITYEQAFEKLSLGDVDYLIIDLFPAIIYSKLLQAEDKVTFLEKPVTVQHFHMCFSKKSSYASLLPKVNTLLLDLQKQGAIKKMAINQYQAWHTGFQKRQRFFSQAQKQAEKAQASYDEHKKDMGLENLARFIEHDISYLMD